MSEMSHILQNKQDSIQTRSINQITQHPTRHKHSAKTKTKKQQQTKKYTQTSLTKSFKYCAPVG